MTGRWLQAAREIVASIGIRPFIGDLEQQAGELAAILRAELLKPKRHVLLLLHCRIGVQN